MFVEWNELRLKVVPRIRGAEKGKPGRKAGNVILHPGVNFVPDKIWNEIKGMLESCIETGRVKIHEKKKDGKITPMTVNEMDPAQVKSLAKETYDLDTLREMKKQDTREDVRAVLQDRELDIEKEYKKMGRSTATGEEPKGKAKKSAETASALAVNKVSE